VNGQCFDSLSHGRSSEDLNCVILTHGDSYCWGTNGASNLAAFDPSDAIQNVFAPVKTGVISDVQEIAISQHVCALLKNGTLWCWAQDVAGEVGQATTGQIFPKPAQIVTPQLGTNVFAHVSLGLQFTCVLKLDGTVWCFGKNGNKNLDGVSSADSPTGVQASFISGAVGIASGNLDSCAWTSTGTGWCWGDNTYSQLATTAVTSGFNQVSLPSGDNFIAGMCVGFQHACAWTSTGAGYCWGDESQGAVGNGVTAASTQDTPVQISPQVGSIKKMSCGTYHTCTLNTIGEVWCWGKGAVTRGRIGQGHDQGTNHPVIPVLIAEPIKDVSAVAATTCFITVSDKLLCTGAYTEGGLGNGLDGSDALAPIEVNTVNINCGNGKNKFKKAEGGKKTKKVAAAAGVLVGGVALGVGLVLRKRKRGYGPLASSPTVAV